MKRKLGRKIQEMPTLCLLDRPLPHKALTWGHQLPRVRDTAPPGRCHSKISPNWEVQFRPPMELGSSYISSQLSL